MKQLIKLIAICAITFLLSGCGHNIGAAFNGTMINVGYDPLFNKVGIQMYNGVLVTGLQKLKSLTHFIYTDSVKSDYDLTVKYINYSTKNGDQITGYAVDLQEAKNK